MARLGLLQVVRHGVLRRLRQRRGRLSLRRLQPLQSLARRLVLRPERTDPQRQLVGMILMLPRLLANTIEPLTDAVAAGQKRLALLGILRHRDRLGRVGGTWKFKRKSGRAIMANRDRVTHYDQK